MIQIAKLNTYTILEVKGNDALTFLQGQISQDLRTLKIGTGKWFGLSNAKGRLLAAGQIYQNDEHSYWLVLPEVIAKNIHPLLQRYKFRSKVEFAIREDLSIYGSWGSRLRGNDDSLEYKHQIQLLENSNCHILVSSSDLETNASENDWTEQKIRNGFPDVFIETQEKFVAQMLNIDLIDGISFSKGCYTGQEIIARMQHLGRIKRRMLAFELDEALAIGDKFEIDGQNLGQVVNIVQSGDKYMALICVQLDKIKENGDLLKSNLNLPYEINSNEP